eukprot:2641077-Alexandrium_andersonii.AAC.1
MSASLVGSEMCIRDSSCKVRQVTRPRCLSSHMMRTCQVPCLEGNGKRKPSPRASPKRREIQVEGVGAAASEWLGEEKP